eukprot:scaffold14476_cov120-Isochrysis_galbana.AAC.12
MDCGYAISITILALATTPIALPVQFQLRLFLYPHCSTALIIVGQNPRSVPSLLGLGEPHLRETRPPPLDGL